VLRPPGTPVLSDQGAVRAALASRQLLPLPVTSAAAAGLQPAGSLSLRPEALATAMYIGTGVRTIQRGPAPLRITAATTGVADLRAAAAASHGLADADPLHATGYAFDVSRFYASPAQAQAFQFMLDRLLALDVIAWKRYPHNIHVVVGPAASALRGLVPKT
jgi:phage tail protein X